MLKKYWKIAAAAAFLTAAGFCYGFLREVPEGSFDPAAGERYGQENFILAEEDGNRGSAENADGKRKFAGDETDSDGAGAYETGPCDPETDSADISSPPVGLSGGWDGEPEVTGSSQIEAGREENIPETTEAVCFVHICGEVKIPGVYELKAGSRIFQAVEAAGGLTEEAAADFINLAAPVLDGMQVQIPGKEEVLGLTEQERGALSERYVRIAGVPGAAASSGPAGVSGAAAGSGMAGEPGGPAGVSGAAGIAGGQGVPGSGGSVAVNINTAGVEELTGLNGIGKARAEDIIRYRSEHGGFKKIEEIMNIPGIKDALFQKIKDSITV